MMVNRSTFNIYKLGYRELGIQDGLPTARTTRTGCSCGHLSQEEDRQEEDRQEEYRQEGDRQEGDLAHCRGETCVFTGLLRGYRYRADPWYRYRLHHGHEDPRRCVVHHPNGRCGDYSVLHRRRSCVSRDADEQARRTDGSGGAEIPRGNLR